MGLPRQGRYGQLLLHWYDHAPLLLVPVPGLRVQGLDASGPAQTPLDGPGQAHREGHSRDEPGPRFLAGSIALWLLIRLTIPTRSIDRGSTAPTGPTAGQGTQIKVPSASSPMEGRRRGTSCI